MAEELDTITCGDAAAWETWLAANHGLRTGVWLKIAKQHSGAASLTNDEAVDVGLCWGWISGHRKALDTTYFLQRYTPRRPKSNWSAVNVAKVEALTAAGRMRPPGLAEVDAAKADGRWDHAVGTSSIRENWRMHADLNAFIDLETKVWDALRRGDAEADARLLAEDFLGVYPSGFANRSDHAGQLANGPTVAEFELSDARLMVLSDDHVLLSYRADWRRFGGDENAPAEAMYITSLWSHRADEWVNVFSQDSPVAFPE